MKKLNLLALIFSTLIMSNSYSQGYPINYTEISVLEKRPLIVELIALLPDSEDTKEINAEISTFNDALKNAIENFWFKKDNIEYKTLDEVDALKKKGNTKYSIIYLSTFNRKYTPDFMDPTKVDDQEYLSENEIRVLNYSKIESKKRPSYSFFMPDLGKNIRKFPSASEINLSVKMMKNHIVETEKLEKKMYNFKKYSKDQAKQNCSEIGNKTLYINKSIAGKMSLTLKLKVLTIENYKKALKNDNVKIITNDEMDKKIASNEDILIGISIPETVAVSTASDAINRKTYFRVFVNAKTGKIYSFAGATSTDNTQFFSEADMKAIAKCK